MMSDKPVIIVGNGGHAKVLADILHDQKVKIIGCTSNKERKSNIDGVKFIGKDEIIYDYGTEEILLINGIGSLPNNKELRLGVTQKFKKHGYMFKSVISNKSFLSSDIDFASGVQVMNGAVIQSGTKIGEHSIINTSASVDHDCIVGANNHISPNATLCGSVKTGNNVHIGAGAVVIENVIIGDNSSVAAGTSVYKNIDRNIIAMNDSRLIFKDE
jgi:sugar O-acyltransferase (sialic acid O-acetyltransferase NeuD family)